MFDRSAFTLMEIMVVVVILGLLAGFAIPNFTNSIQKARERHAIMSAKIVHTVNQVYKARNGEYFHTDDPLITDLGVLNAGLNVNIIGNGLKFEYLMDLNIPGKYLLKVGPGGAAGSAFVIGIDEGEISKDSANPNPCCQVGGSPCLTNKLILPDCVS